MATGEADGRPPEAAAERLAGWLADELAGSGGPARRRLTAGLRQLGEVDRALYRAIASAPAPALDAPMRRLSGAANRSLLWLAIAAGLAVAGGRAGRRGAPRGVAAGGGASGLVDLGV